MIPRHAEPAAGRQLAGAIAPAALTALRGTAKAAAEATTAGRLAEAARLNRRFHQHIAELAGNVTAVRILDRLWDQIQVSTLHSLRPPARGAQASDQHERLLRAIIDGRGEVAGRVAIEHVVDTRIAAGADAAAQG